MKVEGRFAHKCQVAEETLKAEKKQFADATRDAMKSRACCPLPDEDQSQVSHVYVYVGGFPFIVVIGRWALAP